MATSEQSPLPAEAKDWVFYSSKGFVKPYYFGKDYERVAEDSFFTQSPEEFLGEDLLRFIGPPPVTQQEGRKCQKGRNGEEKDRVERRKGKPRREIGEGLSGRMSGFLFSSCLLLISFCSGIVLWSSFLEGGDRSDFAALSWLRLGSCFSSIFIWVLLSSHRFEPMTEIAKLLKLTKRFFCR